MTLMKLNTSLCFGKVYLTEGLLNAS